MKREAYLEVREEPFITIVVVVFGVVLIHSSSVGWMEVEIKEGRGPLERERGGIVMGGTKGRNGVDMKWHNTARESGWG